MVVHDTDLTAVPVQVDVLFLCLAVLEAACLVAVHRQMVDVLRAQATLAVTHPAVPNRYIGSLGPEVHGLSTMSDEEATVHHTVVRVFYRQGRAAAERTDEREVPDRDLQVWPPRAHDARDMYQVFTVSRSIDEHASTAIPHDQQMLSFLEGLHDRLSDLVGPRRNIHGAPVWWQEVQSRLKAPGLCRVDPFAMF